MILKIFATSITVLVLTLVALTLIGSPYSSDSKFVRISCRLLDYVGGLSMIVACASITVLVIKLIWS